MAHVIIERQARLGQRNARALAPDAREHMPTAIRRCAAVRDGASPARRAGRRHASVDGYFFLPNGMINASNHEINP